MIWTIMLCIGVGLIAFHLIVEFGEFEPADWLKEKGLRVTSMVVAAALAIGGGLHVIEHGLEIAKRGIESQPTYSAPSGQQLRQELNNDMKNGN